MKTGTSQLSLGPGLKRFRLLHGLTQSQLAAELGIADRTYKYYELDKRLPTGDVLSKLHSMGLDVNELLSGEPTDKAHSFDQFVDIFQAFERARTAYIKFEARSVSWSDATESERREIRAAGEALASIGGTACMGAAIRSFFPSEAERTLAAGSQLNHLWNGIDGWMA